MSEKKKSDEYHSSTKEILKKQLEESMPTKPKKTYTNTYDGGYDYGHGGSHYDDYEYLNRAYGGYDYEDVDDSSSAEYLIQKMEMNPSEIARVASEESVTTIADIITLLLYR